MHLGELGIIDILLVPVDGSYTIAQAAMKQVIEQIRPAVVIPMHFFGTASLDRFLALMGEDWEVVTIAGSSLAFSRITLPQRRVVVLQPERW